MSYEYNGKTYELLPGTGCEGCAFFRGPDEMHCFEAPDCTNGWWVERKAPTPDANGWVPWGGGSMPVSAGTRVEVVGRKIDDAWEDLAGDLRWDHIGSDGDIFKYRVVAPAPDDHEALTFHELPVDSKPTNPKDAIGIRKAPLSVLPMGVVAEMGVGLLEGASKYGRHNYRGVGVRASVYFDATMRHLISWWEGEDLDPDSGMSHISKALCSLAVLRDAQMQGMCTDDRPPRSMPFYSGLNYLSGEILDRHADKNPKHYTIQDTV